MCVYRGIHAHMHVSANLHDVENIFFLMCLHGYVSGNVYVHMSININMHMHVCSNLHMHVCSNVHIHVCSAIVEKIICSECVNVVCL
jgi:hypothetical protein